MIVFVKQQYCYTTDVNCQYVGKLSFYTHVLFCFDPINNHLNMKERKNDKTKIR